MYLIYICEKYNVLQDNKSKLSVTTYIHDIAVRDDTYTRQVNQTVRDDMYLNTTVRDDTLSG